jgi:cobalt-zinc-cadmium efflux system protein
MTKKFESKKRLLIALAITIIFLFAEIIAGFWSGSLALLADAGHMFTDAGALSLSLLVLWLSEKPPTPKRTFGYRRTEILAALANGLTLWVTVGVIAHEAYHRFHNPPDLLTGPMFWVAVAGLLANLGSAWILKSSHKHEHTLNVKGAYLHVLADCWGSVGVIVAAIVVSTTGYKQADPLASVLICGLILYSSWGLIKESLIVLLEATPSHVDVAKINGVLTSISGVVGIHDLHVWTITSGFDALSCHVTVEEGTHGYDVLKRIQDILRDSFGIKHTTIQIEKGERVDLSLGEKNGE